MAIAVILLGTTLFAAWEDVLIDFNVLGGYENDADVQFQMLYNDRWTAKLNSSADFILNRKLTYCKNAPVKGTITKENGFVGGQGDGSVLGIRINYPSSDYNAYAIIAPKFEVESYGGQDGKKFLNKGLLKNIGTIKTISSYIKGKNFPHSIYVKLKNENDEVKSYHLGYLNYDGWAIKSWENLDYLAQVRDRQLVRVPLYPRVEPLVKIDSFVIFRDGATLADNFVTYIGWVSVTYDKAIIKDDNDDIDDEAIWQIETDDSNLKAKLEKERLDRTRELEDLELKKMNKEPKADTAAPAATPAAQ